MSTGFLRGGHCATLPPLSASASTRSQGFSAPFRMLRMSQSSAPAELLQAAYVQHRGWLHRWLTQKLGCTDRAEDLAQDTFVRILSSRQPQSWDWREPRAYLRVVANGLLIDYFRHRSLEAAYLDALAQFGEPLVASPEERELVMEALQRIDAMLDRLPTRTRRIFLMAQLEDMTYAQIAEALGISLRTVKRAMQEAFASCLSAML